jgi:hypothetical protein
MQNCGAAVAPDRHTSRGAGLSSASIEFNRPLTARCAACHHGSTRPRVCENALIA